MIRCVLGQVAAKQELGKQVQCVQCLAPLNAGYLLSVMSALPQNKPLL